MCVGGGGGVKGWCRGWVCVCWGGGGGWRAAYWSFASIFRSLSKLTIFWGLSKFSVFWGILQESGLEPSIELIVVFI